MGAIKANVNLLSVNFFLTLITIIISGNLSIRIFDPSVIYVSSLTVFMVFAAFKKVKFTYLDLMVVIFFSVLIIVQVVEFGSVAVMASLGFLIKILIAILVIRLVSNFLYCYIFIMYLLACMSLIFFIPIQLGIDLAGAFSPFSVFHEMNYRTVIFFHNFHYDWETMRNSGMFWEPGAFAGYIVIALLFTVWINKGKLILNRVNVVLIITLITTQSTTGILAFLVLIVCHLYHSDKIRTTPMIFPLVAVLFMSVVYIAVVQVDFLGKKIELQLSDAGKGDKWSQINRFGNILFDRAYIEDRPLTGWSANPETRFAANEDLEELIAGMGNGLTGFVVRYGIPAGLFCYYLLLAGARRVTASWAISIFSVLIVSMLLMGEIFFDFPIFLTLWFMTRKIIKLKSTIIYEERYYL